jgi:ParB-like chromosome segregation protein Spo0J
MNTAPHQKTDHPTLSLAAQVERSVTNTQETQMLVPEGNSAGRHRRPDSAATDPHAYPQQAGLFDTAPMALTPIASLRRATTLLTTDLPAARTLIEEAIAQLVGQATTNDEGLVRRDGAPTSRAAAAAVRSGSQRARVLLWLVQHSPATDVQIAERLGLSPNSERPRRVELVTAGFVADSGEVRRHHGANHALWTITDAGRAAAGELGNAA